MIVYSRNNGVLTPETALRLAERVPNFVALKDGTGDFDPYYLTGIDLANFQKHTEEARKQLSNLAVDALDPTPLAAHI